MDGWMEARGMTCDQLKQMVRDCIARNPMPSIPILVESVSKSEEFYTVVLVASAKGLGDFDFAAYYKRLERCLSEKTDATVIFTGLQPEVAKSELRRDAEK
jgi:hypothetical protein